jgi:hypothetical protein
VGEFLLGVGVVVVAGFEDGVAAQVLCELAWSETECADNCASVGPTSRAVPTHVTYESQRRMRPCSGQSISLKSVRSWTGLKEVGGWTKEATSAWSK